MLLTVDLYFFFCRCFLYSWSTQAPFNMRKQIAKCSFSLEKTAFQDSSSVNIPVPQDFQSQPLNKDLQKWCKFFEVVKFPDFCPLRPFLFLRYGAVDRTAYTDIITSLAENVFFHHVFPLIKSHLPFNGCQFQTFKESGNTNLRLFPRKLVDSNNRSKHFQCNKCVNIREQANLPNIYTEKVNIVCLTIDRRLWFSTTLYT